MMPRRDYRNAKGERLKGVTSVLQCLAKPALIMWGYKQGLSGVPLYEKRDKAADAGTFAHLLVQHHLKGLPEPSRDGLAKDIIDKAESCYIAFMDWEKAHSFKLIESEKELVSEEMQIGGTIDIGAIVNELGIIDIKTGKDIYLEAWCQVAAYGRIWTENYPDNPIKGYHILRLGSEGDFDHKYRPSLEDEFQIFLGCLQIQKVLDKKEWKL